MVDRIFQNWKTTSIGLVILTIAGVAVATNKATLTEAGAFLAIGIGLFFTKDGRLKNE